MSRASTELGKNASRPAYEAEEAALQSLLEGQMAMEEAAGMMSGATGESKGGGTGSRTRRVMSRGGQGSSGAALEPVRLPSVSDYKPPAAFREELLKALKEKYPKVYEDIIYKYYKRLAD